MNDYAGCGYQDCTVPAPKEASLISALAEADKYADEIFNVLSTLEIKLLRGPNKPACEKGLKSEKGAVQASRDLATKLASITGFVRTIDNAI